MANLNTIVSIAILISLSSVGFGWADNFFQDIDITWGDGRGQILDGGNLVSLTMDKASGSGFQSKRDYLFGRFDMQMKLVPGNSAGTVTTFYLTSQGDHHDEVDLEFLGNLSGSPYTLHTNVFSQGLGGREQEFLLWFDPTNDFHTYSIVWNPQRIIIFVDNIPVRVFNNLERVGVSYPNKQPMKVIASLWDAEQWATRGGTVKTDWSKAPFTALYRNIHLQTTDSSGDKPWLTLGLDINGRKWLRWVQQHHMIYNYCTDPKRHGGPRECRNSRFL